MFNRLFILIVTFLFLNIKFALCNVNGIIIEQIIIDDEIPSWGEIKVWGNIDYEELDAKALPVNPKFKFSFESITFVYILQNKALSKFRYKLVGKSNDWSKPEYKYEVKFTNLKPGRYTLHLEALEDSKITLEKIYPFSIEPRINQTINFDLITIFLSLIIITALILNTKIPKKKQLH